MRTGIPEKGFFSMRKLLSTLLAGALTASPLFLTACGTQKEPASKDSTTFAEQPQTPEMAEPKENAAKEVKEDTALKKSIRDILGDYGGTQGVYYFSVDSGDGFDINGDKQIASASMIKLLILAELLQQVADGELSLDEQLTVASQDIVGGTGIIQNYGSGSYSVEKLARLMIAESDNTATNVLIDKLGMGAVNGEAERLGLSNTVLARKMMDTAAQAAGRENYTSANDLGAILRLIAKDELVSPKYSKLAKQFLLEQSDNEGLAQGLQDESFGHKTGTLSNQRHDGGIVYGDNGAEYVLVVMTQDMGISSANNLMSQVAAKTNSSRQQREEPTRGSST